MVSAFESHDCADEAQANPNMARGCEGVGFRVALTPTYVRESSALQ